MKNSSNKITFIRKRNGDIVPYDREKIVHAIKKAVEAVGGKDFDQAAELAMEVEQEINRKFHHNSIPAVEEVQDLVENILIEKKHARVAKAYILYRAERARERAERELILGTDSKTLFSNNALKVLEKRYLLRDEEGEVAETPEELLRRVAHAIAAPETNYGGNAEEMEEKFYDMMASLSFMPNSPTLMNAGTGIGQLSACFVLPVEDSIEGIFTTLKHAALIHKSGGGTGFGFSNLRPANDMVKSTTGVSSGPISFMRIFDSMTEQIKQGGKRRGANMGILRVDHPDILDFITAKADMTSLTNFNISVAATEKFMDAVIEGEDYELYNPRTKEPVKTLPAREVFNMIVQNAWKNGDPGLIFIDEINKKSPVRHLGEIESTNPCGEQPLLPYESCNLGSINLSTFVDEDATDLDWDRLGETVDTCIQFLDNVIDVNNYPIEEIAKQTRTTRKIGLGVMGFADVLYQMMIPYDSPEGMAYGEKIMKFIHERAMQKSMELAEVRGTFPGWEGSDHEKAGLKVRNACVTTIAPTGTIGMIAEASGGVEPNFAISFIKYVMDGTELVYTNKYFEAVAKKRGFYSQELMKRIAQVGSIQGFEQEIPEDIRRVFVTAQDISPENHIKMQATFQSHVDSSISKTINFPSSATMKDVEEGYLLAYKLKCKGVTIYRDGSRENQVLNIGKVNKKEHKEPVVEITTREIPTHEMPASEMVQHTPVQDVVAKSKAQLKKEGVCPDCKSRLVINEGCASCASCGFSACMV